LEAVGLEPPYLQVSIQDDGPGIPHDLQRRLFNKFVTGNRKHSGSGLGLAFCRLVVEAHAGQIWLESEVGQGTTFHFTLPVAPIEDGLQRPEFDARAA
jgi:signal transduction histidine kinase